MTGCAATRWLSLLLIASLLPACMVGPDYQRPEMEMPEQWHQDLRSRGLEGPTISDKAWVEIFQDEELRRAIETALANNRGLLIAIERIEEARALSRVARSGLYPQVDAEFNAEREEESDLTNTNAETADEFFFGPSLAWEVDLWGANRRVNRAGWASYLAAEYGAEAVRLSLISDVSRTWFELQGVESRLEINRDTLGAREQALEIARKRHKGGLTSKLEVIQSEVELAATRASLPKAEQRRLVVENRLSLLMGLPPTHQASGNKLGDQFVPAAVTPDLPVSLLQRRPDIMQSEQELRVASEGVGIATARLLPNIRITGALGYETDEFGDLLDDDGDFWIANLDVVMPLFNAGARRAELKAAESRFNQARLVYERSVLQAMREVSDALNQFYKSGETLEAELQLQRASEEYLDLAFKRYRNGVLAYIDVLDARRSLFEAQISVSVARQAQLFSLVDLYKALGGGWDPAAIAAKTGS